MNRQSRQRTKPTGRAIFLQQSANEYAQFFLSFSFDKNVAKRNSRNEYGSFGCFHEVDCAQITASHEHMIAMNDQFVVLADARIDNRRDLMISLPCIDLEGDAHLILAAWCAWGKEAVSRLYGDFAFVVLDRRTRDVFLVRDHIGSVPLWYAQSEDGMLVVGTEMATVANQPGLNNEVDLPALAEFIQRGSLPGGSQTLLSKVRRVPSRTVLRLWGDEEDSLVWWDPASFHEAPHLSEPDMLRQFETLLHHAVEDRLEAASRVAVHLSGGLDSASIALIAQRVLRSCGHKIRSGFAWQAAPDPSTPSTEHQRVTAIAEATDIPIFFAPATVEDMRETFMQNVFHRPPPEMHCFELPILRRCKADGVGVILSGWGGDECVSFSGRNYFRDLLLGLRLRQLGRHQSEGNLTRLQFFVTHALRPALQELRDTLTLRKRRMFRRRRIKRKTVLISDHLKGYLKPPQNAEPSNRSVGLRAQLLTHGHLQRRIESWADLAGQYGIRYRYPLLDRRLLEFVLQIPTDRFYKGTMKRWPMREVLKRLGAPEAIVSGSKLETERVDNSLATLNDVLVDLAKEIRQHDLLPDGADWVDFKAMERALSIIENEEADTAAKAAAYSTMRFYQRAFQVLDWSREDSQASADDK